MWTLEHVLLVHSVEMSCSEVVTSLSVSVISLGTTVHTHTLDRGNRITVFLATCESINIVSVTHLDTGRCVVGSFS